MLNASQHFRLIYLFSAASLLAVTACNEPLDSQGEPLESASAELAETEDVEKCDGARGHKSKRSHKKGVHSLLKKALHLDSLSDAQRTTLEKLRTDLKQDKGDAHKSFRVALAERVRNGSFEASFVDDHMASMRDNMKARSAAQTEALQQLHSTLTAEQRTAIADKALDGKHAKHGKDGKFAKHGKDGKHFKHGKDGKFAKHGKDGKFAKHGKDGKFAKHGKDGKLAKGLLKGIELSDEQETKLREAKARVHGDRPDHDEMKLKYKAMRDRHRAMLTAFASDDFDASAFSRADVAEHIAKGLTKKVEWMKTLISILDADQRSAVADRIEAGPDKRKRGHEKQLRPRLDAPSR